MKPKAEYFDALVDRKVNINIRDTAKELGIKQKKFVNWLLANKYVYRDSHGRLKPYAEYADMAGFSALFVLKEFVNGDYGSTQMFVTPKGRETFRLLLQTEVSVADETADFEEEY